MPTTKRTIRRPGSAAPLRRKPSTGGGPSVAASAGPGTLREVILAEPRELSHVEVHRRLTARRVRVSFAYVARVRAAEHGPREAGRPATTEAALLLATIRDVAERHGVTPGDVVVAGDRALTSSRSFLAGDL